MSKIIISISFLFIFPIILFASVTDFGFENTILKSNKNGVKIYEKNDGTIIKSYKSHDEAQFKDGTIIKKYKKGIREITYSDGRKIVINDAKGTRIYYSKNGKKRIITMDSRTPYGDLIVPVKRGIQKNPVSVMLTYNPKKSDDVLEGEIKKIFNELYSQLRRNIIKKRFEGKSPLEVSVSFCRFCRTGYCYKKEQKVVVEFIINNKIKKKIRVKYLLLKDKKKRKEFLVKTANLLYSL